jgi:hypothetical protein
VSALHIAIDQDKHQANTLAYHKALAGKRLDWEPEYGKADKASAVVFKKFPVPAPHLSWDIASQVEARELLREVQHDPGGHRLSTAAVCKNVKISPSQVSKMRARLRQRLLEE